MTINRYCFQVPKRIKKTEFSNCAVLPFCHRIKPFHITIIHKKSWPLVSSIMHIFHKVVVLAKIFSDFTWQCTFNNIIEVNKRKKYQILIFVV